MKKSLIALAVAGAFAAPAAFAATSNVDIYGKLHMSVNVYDDQADDVADVGSSSNASRIGFKGRGPGRWPEGHLAGRVQREPGRAVWLP